MKRVTTVEMQSRLCELLARQDGELTQVTYQGKPVVAVLTLERYQALLAQITYQLGKPVIAVLATERYHVPQASAPDQPTMTVEVTREAITQGQLLFPSYTNRLAPRFQSDEHLVKIIEVTRRKKPVGALLAWNDWQHLSGAFPLEEPLTLEDHTLQVVAARNHLLKLPEQFAREEVQGIFAPITVIKQGEPVMAIVSWQWFQYVIKALHVLVEANGTVRRHVPADVEHELAHPPHPSHIEPLQAKDESPHE